MIQHLITFDMDTSCLKETYHGNNWNKAYYDIANILKSHGFNRIHQAKQRFTQRLKNLKATLLENGLTELQIENILKLEEFSLEP